MFLHNSELDTWLFACASQHSNIISLWENPKECGVRSFNTPHVVQEVEISFPSSPDRRMGFRIGQQDAPGLGLFSLWAALARQSQRNIPYQAFIVHVNFTSSQEVQPALTSWIQVWLSTWWATFFWLTIISSYHCIATGLYLAFTNSMHLAGHLILILHISDLLLIWQHGRHHIFKNRTCS